MVGKQVTGARLGIIGMGRVGQAFAKKARGFDMEIHYYNRSPLTDAQAMGAVYHSDIDSLLAVSDFLGDSPCLGVDVGLEGAISRSPVGCFGTDI